MAIKVITKSKEETISLAKELSKHLFKGSIITLRGDLGAGKTTFTKGVGEGLEIEDEINSPTFNILKCYFNKKTMNLYHIDAYRLEDVSDENKNIGLEEVIEGDGVCLIEWPMFIEEFIPQNFSLDIDIHILSDGSREFTFSSNSKKYDEIMNFLKEYQK